MKLNTARLCLDCDEVHDEAQCPSCASESFAFIKRWVKAPEARAHAAEVNESRVERAATYRALLAANNESNVTKRLVRGGVVGLAVLGAAGWLLQRNAAAKNRNDQASSSDEPAS
jgi:hypothetical protein